MVNAITQFQFRENFVRTTIINGEINFCLSDVCGCLGLQNPTHTANQIKEEFETPTLNVGIVESTSNRQLEATFITESQLYFVMMRSRSMIAKSFRKWICEEVLPSIRRTGSYSLSINKEQAGELSALIAERFPEGSQRPYAWGRFNNHFRLASYKDLPVSKFEEACKYIQQIPLKKDAGPSGKRYHYPLETARPKGWLMGSVNFTASVLADKRNPAPELDLINELENDGFDVRGAKARILSMHYALDFLTDKTKELRSLQMQAEDMILRIKLFSDGYGKLVGFNIDPENPMHQHLYKDFFPKA